MPGMEDRITDMIGSDGFHGSSAELGLMETPEEKKIKAKKLLAMEKKAAKNAAIAKKRLSKIVHGPRIGSSGDIEEFTQ